MFGSAAAQTPPAPTPPRTPQESIEVGPAEPGEKETVRTRPRPEYDPLGIRLGAFFLYPRASLSETFRDNIFYTDTNDESDFITVLSLGAALRSNWNVHALNLYADTDLGFYASNGDEDYQDYRFGIDGRLDITRDTNAAGGFKFANLHEARSSPDQTSASEPVTYLQYGPSVVLSHRFNRLSAKLGTDVIFYDYDDAKTASGATINMDDRDRRDIIPSLRVGYEIIPRYEAFVRGSVNWRDYDTAADDAGRDRDSDGFEVVTGLAIDLGGVAWGNVFIGYLRQSFDDARFKTIDGVGFGGDITWNPTKLTTVNVGVSRTVEDTTLGGAGGSLTTGVRASVDHELLRNLILTAGGAYRNYDYEGITRADDVFSVGGGADFLFNPHLRLRLHYEYEARESNIAGADYGANTVTLRLFTQY